jgi:hypothetical protein
MCALLSYKIFISHGLNAHADYTRLTELLDEDESFAYSATSIVTPYRYRSMPKAKIEEMIRTQLKGSNCFIALDGVYQECPEWGEFELNSAARMGVPIIGVRAWKSKVISPEIEEVAKDVVGWKTAEIEAAIEEYARKAN